MQKLLLISILIMTVAIPIRAAQAPQPVLGLRRAVVQMFGFVVLYVLAALYIYPRL